MVLKNRTIGQRIESIMLYLGDNKSSFSKRLGLTNNVTIGRIIKENRSPSFEILNKIAKNIPEINCNWLIKGEESMLKSSKLYTNKELLNTLIDNNNELLEDENFRKYLRANIKTLQAEDLRTERIEEMKKIKERIIQKQNNK